MEVIITDIEKLKKYPNSEFIYFNFFGNQKKTIVTPKVKQFLKVFEFNIGDVIEIQKGFRNDKEIFIIRKLIRRVKDE